MGAAGQDTWHRLSTNRFQLATAQVSYISSAITQTDGLLRVLVLTVTKEKATIRLARNLIYFHLSLQHTIENFSLLSKQTAWGQISKLS